LPQGPIQKLTPSVRIHCGPLFWNEAADFFER
jgi:hypothetical protein